MTNKELPHIGLTFPDTLPDQIVEKYKAELSKEHLRIAIRKIHFGGPYACLEWAVPTLIGVFILKSYFDGFLKEAGKNHYIILKDWLKKSSAAARQIEVTTLAAGISINKLEKDNSQSKVFSIQTKTNQGYPLKFLFDEKLTTENWHTAIDRALELLDNHFTNGISDQLTIEISSVSLKLKDFQLFI